MESTLKRTWAEIDLDHLTHNFEVIRRRVRGLKNIFSLGSYADGELHSAESQESVLSKIRVRPRPERHLQREKQERIARFYSAYFSRRQRAGFGRKGVLCQRGNIARGAAQAHSAVAVFDYAAYYRVAL